MEPQHTPPRRTPGGRLAALAGALVPSIVLLDWALVTIPGDNGPISRNASMVIAAIITLLIAMVPLLAFGNALAVPLRALAGVTRNRDADARVPAPHGLDGTAEPPASDGPRETLTRARWERDDLCAQALATLSEGILLLDLEGRCRLWNRHLESLTGIATERTLGRLPADACPSLEPLRLAEAASQALSGEVVAIAEILVDFPRSGRRARISATLAPVRAADGTITGVLCQLREGAAASAAAPGRRAVADRIRRAQADAALERMRTAIAHELRAPLGVIETRLDALESRIGPADEGRAHLDAVREQARRVERLLRELSERERAAATDTGADPDAGAGPP